MEAVMETAGTGMAGMAGMKEAPGDRTARTTARDWAGFREGVREVFLTLVATFAIGFAWAAIEMARLGMEPGDVGASRYETGYDDAAWTGQ